MALVERRDLLEAGLKVLTDTYLPAESERSKKWHERYKDGRFVFHGSEAGECIRKLCYRYLNGQDTSKFPMRGMDLDGALRLHDGEAHADSSVHWLSNMGIKVTDRERQFRKRRKGGYVISGRVDGIAEVPSEGQYILEMKGLSTWTVKKDNPLDIVSKQYRYQAQVYMYLTGIHKTLFVIKDKNNSQLRFFVLTYSPKVMKSILLRWRRVMTAVQKAKLLGREYDWNPATGRGDIQCSWCAFNHHCWK